MSPELSIVIPCYNEEKNIPLLLSRFSEFLKNLSIEIILVNNGSTDLSAAVLADLLPQYPFARTTHVKVNQGYGFGILSGLKEARGNFLGWTHADLQTDPADIVKAFELIKAKDSSKDIFIKGHRRGRPLFDEVFTVAMSCFESIYMGKNLYDINAQPNIFHKDFFASWKNPPHDFSLDLYAYYQARRENLDIVRFDVQFPARLHGQSSWNNGFASKWKFIKRTFNYSLKLKKELKTRNG